MTNTHVECFYRKLKHNLIKAWNFMNVKQKREQMQISKIFPFNTTPYVRYISVDPVNGTYHQKVNGSSNRHIGVAIQKR